MKTINIDRESVLNEMRSFNEIFRKDGIYDNIKSKKKKKRKKKQKQEEDTLEVTFFGKTIGRGSPGVFRVYV